MLKFFVVDQGTQRHNKKSPPACLHVFDKNLQALNCSMAQTYTQTKIVTIRTQSAKRPVELLGIRATWHKMPFKFSFYVRFSGIKLVFPIKNLVSGFISGEIEKGVISSY